MAVALPLEPAKQDTLELVVAVTLPPPTTVTPTEAVMLQPPASVIVTESGTNAQAGNSRVSASVKPQVAVFWRSAPACNGSGACIAGAGCLC